MNIGFDSKRAFFNNTGLGNYSRDTIRILGKYFPSNKYFLYTPKIITNNRLNFIRESNNFFVRSPRNILNKIFKNYWRTKNIVKNLIDDQIDIYHGLSHELPLGIEKTNIKSIVTIHDLIFIRFPHFFSSIDRKIYKYKCKSACERASKIIAISNQTKRDIIQYLKISEKKINVIYQGCNNDFKQKINNEIKQKVFKKFNLPSTFCLYVGSIEERKNLLTLLKAMTKVNNKYLDLVVIGKGKKYKEKCIKYIIKNNLKNRVHFIENISTKEIAVIYHLAKMMIYPSKYEGFGIPIIESLFCKTPVITTKGGCFSESGGPNSMYVNSDCEIELSSAINTLLNKSEVRDKMKKEGFIYAQNFEDEIIANNLMTTYKTLYS